MDLINKKPDDKNRLTKRHVSEIKDKIDKYLKEQKQWRIDNIPQNPNKDKREIFLLKNELRALRECMKFLYSQLNKLVTDPDTII